MASQPAVVVVGGGIVGCSVAYHLAKCGLKDVLLVEQRQLTCGTTWHAAGLLGQLRASPNLTKLAQYTTRLYAGLEEETGTPTGYTRTGSLTIATNPERLEEIRRQASMARSFGLEAEEIGRDRVMAEWSCARSEDILGAIYLPGDGTTNPVDTTLALAAGARQHGAQIVQEERVQQILVEEGGVRGVVTDKRVLAADVVVLCTGMWTHALAATIGVNVPLHAAEHFYIVTEPIPDLPATLPTLREPDACAYFKREAGGRLLVGFFEPRALPWGMDGIPEDFFFSELPERWDHLAPQVEAAVRRIPALEAAGIRKFFNGPEAFTPDDRYYLGESPDVAGCFVAAGFNSIGIQSAGGVGKVLADWIVDGAAPMDLWDVDIRRALPFQGDPKFLAERTVESPGLLYAMHWPSRQFETGRDIYRSPVHERLQAAGACFAEAAGWERPGFFARKGTNAGYEYSWGRQNWFEPVAAECRVVREHVGFFDQTSFTKIDVRGVDAERFLNRVCANEVAVEPGRVVYTQWLNARAGIEADLTVTRLGEEEFLVIGGVATSVRDRAWLEGNLASGERVEIKDVTRELAVFGVMGPEARQVLEELTSEDLATAAFPFATSRQLELAGIPLRASRITYVGELGWELYVPWEGAPGVYDALLRHGESPVAPCGTHAMESLRIEKAYRHWGHDVTPDDNPIEAGLSFAVAMDKADFIGREAFLRLREEGPTRRLVNFLLRNPDPLLHHDEPIWTDGRRVGRITSGSYSHTFGAAIGMGYVAFEAGQTREALEGANYEIEIAGQRVPAQASLRPFYDPGAERVRA